MFATISSGHPDAADLFLLIAVILFAIAAITTMVPLRDGRWSTAAGWAGGCFLALAFLVL